MLWEMLLVQRLDHLSKQLSNLRSGMPSGLWLVQLSELLWEMLLVRLK